MIIRSRREAVRIVQEEFLVQAQKQGVFFAEDVPLVAKFCRLESKTRKTTGKLKMYPIPARDDIELSKSDYN